MVLLHTTTLPEGMRYMKKTGEYAPVMSSNGLNVTVLINNTKPLYWFLQVYIITTIIVKLLKEKQLSYKQLRIVNTHNYPSINSKPNIIKI